MDDLVLRLRMRMVVDQCIRIIVLGRGIMSISLSCLSLEHFERVFHDVHRICLFCTSVHFELILHLKSA